MLIKTITSLSQGLKNSVIFWFTIPPLWEQGYLLIILARQLDHSGFKSKFSPIHLVQLPSEAFLRSTPAPTNVFWGQRDRSHGQGLVVTKTAKYCKCMNNGSLSLGAAVLSVLDNDFPLKKVCFLYSWLALKKCPCHFLAMFCYQIAQIAVEKSDWSSVNVTGKTFIQPTSF